MKIVRISLFIAIFCIGILIAAEYYGFIWHNDIFAHTYRVRGLDVSHYQGEIHWAKVAEDESYQFVFIKATEGDDFIDNQFTTNWAGARQHGVLTGAYHFFSMRSGGYAQAEHFMTVVPNEAYSLPPAIDLEISNSYDTQVVQTELNHLVTALEQHYHKKPIFYATYETYNRYLAGQFPEHTIWIRNIVRQPKLIDERKWTFWQYTNRGRVSGIDGRVDINVFNGTQAEFDQQYVATNE